MTDNKQYPDLPNHRHSLNSGDFAPLYTARQMLDFVDADRAMRAAQAGPQLAAQPSASMPTVEQVEDDVGMGHGAWDMVDPDELIRVIVTLATAPKAEPAHPTAGIWVPTELAERVQETMGEFLMDHGWRQQDMDTSDEFGALLAVATKAEPTPAVEVGGPLNELEELNLLNKLIKLGARAANAHAKSNSDDGQAGTAAYVEWAEIRAYMRELIRKAYATPAPAAQEDAVDAARYRGLRDLAKEQLLYPQRAASSLAADMRTHWELPVLICSGPIGGYRDFDSAVDCAIDAARAAQGESNG